MQQISLNEIYSEFYSGNIQRGELESFIYTYLVNNKNKTCINHWKQEKYEDFISHFYPHLGRIIDSYQDIGLSFEAYLYKYMQVSAKEYNVRTTINAVVEYSTWSARVPDMYLYEEPPVYTVNHTSIDTREIITQMLTGTNGRKSSRQILALVLKCYYYLSDDFAEKIAPLIGMGKKELIVMLNKIRKIRRNKDDNIYFMKERIHCQFYRCIVYENKLSL